MTPAIQKTEAYEAQASPETLRELGTTEAQGLSSEEAAERLKRYGSNIPEEHEEPTWHRIFRRFWGPIPWMIEVAGVLSAIVHKWEDLTIILIMLVVNAVLDFMQESRAKSALKALKQHLAATARVCRDGVFGPVPVADLVPGDILKLRIGDILPADVKLLTGDYLSVDQAALTGESLPVSKRSGDIAFANTTVKQGEMTAVVVNTGVHTNFHTVVSLVAKAELEESSHFQKMVMQIGNFLIAITAVLVVLIFAVAMSRGEDFFEIASFSLVLAVAAIPVALPAVLSVTMAVGALELAKRQAIVSRLVAIEELAGVDIFCSDKTGTLTKNEMTVSDPAPQPGVSVDELFRVAVLASREENDDPVERPIFDFIGQELPELGWRDYTQLDFQPFDPSAKRTSAHVERGDERFVAIKGAPQVVMELAGLDEADKALAEAK